MRKSALLVTLPRPTPQTEEDAEQPGKGSISKISLYCSQRLCIRTPAPFLSFFLDNKKKGEKIAENTCCEMV